VRGGGGSERVEGGQGVYGRDWIRMAELERVKREVICLEEERERRRLEVTLEKMMVQGEGHIVWQEVDHGV